MPSKARFISTLPKSVCRNVLRRPLVFHYDITLSRCWFFFFFFWLLFHYTSHHMGFREEIIIGVLCLVVGGWRLSVAWYWLLDGAIQVNGSLTRPAGSGAR